MLKTYILQKKTSVSSIQMFTKDGTIFVTFRSVGFGSNYSTGLPRFSTTKRNEQEAIEASEMFKEGKIKLESSVKETPCELEESTPEDPISGAARKILDRMQELMGPAVINITAATPPADKSATGQGDAGTDDTDTGDAETAAGTGDTGTGDAETGAGTGEPVTPEEASITIPGQPAVVVEEETVTPAQVITPIPPKSDVYPEVTTSQAAKEILRTDFGVMAKDLKNREMILSAASENGVSFPNLKIEP